MKRREGYKESRHHIGRTDSSGVEAPPPLSSPRQTSGTVAEWNTDKGVVNFYLTLRAVDNADRTVNSLAMKKKVQN